MHWKCIDKEEYQQIRFDRCEIVGLEGLFVKSSFSVGMAASWFIEKSRSILAKLLPKNQHFLMKRQQLNNVNFSLMVKNQEQIAYEQFS